MRDVRLATLKLAADLGNEELAISISRLCAIEARDAVPGIHRVYSLAQVYGIDVGEILSWYGLGSPSDSNAEVMLRTMKAGAGK